MKRIECEGVGDNNGFYEMEVSIPKDFIEETMKEFEKIIGVIPDRAIMEQYGKEFCVMCGRPTANDKTVIELRNLLKSALLAQRTEMLKAVEEVRRNTLKELILEQQANELDGKGYDFYFAIRTKLDALTAVRETLQA